MKNISLNIDKALGTVTKEQVYAQAAKAHESNATLQNGNGAGNDFLGWLHLPSSITDAELISHRKIQLTYFVPNVKLLSPSVSAVAI